MCCILKLPWPYDSQVAQLSMGQRLSARGVTTVTLVQIQTAFCRGKLQDYVIVLVRLYYNLCIALEWFFYSTE